MVNPARSYDRKEITAMIIAAGFTEYRIIEEDSEIRIKLKKRVNIGHPSFLTLTPMIRSCKIDHNSGQP
jgi:hypothetical protein